MRLWFGVLVLLAGLGATIAADTIPGTGNFCVLTSATVDEILDHLAREGVEMRTAPASARARPGPSSPSTSAIPTGTSSR